MPEAISNTSPLLYLYRIEALDWLPELFTQIWTPMAVVHELQEGRRKGYDVPNPADYAWLHIMEPRSMPSEWLILRGDVFKVEETTTRYSAITRPCLSGGRSTASIAPHHAAIHLSGTAPAGGWWGGSAASHV
jgi:hypothetical protein